MKNLLLSFFLLPIICFSQTAENAALMLTYVSYTDGQYHLSIINKPACDADVMLNWNNKGKDSSFRVPAKSTIKLNITADYMPGSVIKVKANSTCMNGSGGWVSITVPALTVLSVQVIEFTATKALDKVKLRFSLSFTGGFPFAVLERSNNAKTWSALYVISSDMEHEYTDKYPSAGTSFYRLKMVDASSVTYSNILTVIMNNNAIERIKVYDLNGRYYDEIKATNTLEARIALNRFSKGIYLLTANNNTSWKVCNF